MRRRSIAVVCFIASLHRALANHGHGGLQVQISVANGLLNHSTDGRVSLMFAPAGVDPLDDTDVSTSPNKFFGQNAYHVNNGDTITLSGGSNYETNTGVFGWPNVSLSDIPTGNYSVQAFMMRYETVTRSDGSKVSVHFPCGDGAPNVDGYGSLTTSRIDTAIHGGPQTIKLTFNNITQPDEPFTGDEIGACNQGNYENTKNLKYVKIRSSKLSEFWNRDMYIGANVLLPAGYDASDKAKRYPVIYSQGHWPANGASFRYLSNSTFQESWDKGIIPGQNGQPDRPAPKLILVQFRHEAPYYDDSYAVNTANMGPYGDAINDELIPILDGMFNTITEPYARVQEGGSTGGWESIANLVFRPDLFGVTYTSYPDSLDFHRHQDIQLYTNENAYVNADGSSIPSIREFPGGVETVVTSVAQENHWELTFGTSSRSFNQWDVWNAVYGVQGYNNYPLEPWDKVTGEIYSDAVELWKPMDLSNWITSNWDNSLNLGEVLKHRIFIYVGTWDNYYLNEGVMEFQKRTDAAGGAGWANVTILPNQTHGGNYQRRETWNFIELAYSWIQDHAPNGKAPLSKEVTSSASRGNKWTDVLAHGGRQAAVARQAPPKVTIERKNGWEGHWGGSGSSASASVGRWDPGVVLEAQWIVNGRPAGKGFTVTQGQTLKYTTGRRMRRGSLQLAVTGRKRGYEEETRKSNTVRLGW